MNDSLLLCRVCLGPGLALGDAPVGVTSVGADSPQGQEHAAHLAVRHARRYRRAADARSLRNQ